MQAKKTYLLSGFFYILDAVFTVLYAFGMQWIFDSALVGDVYYLIQSVVLTAVFLILLISMGTLATKFRLDYTCTMLLAVKHRRLSYLFGLRPKKPSDDTNELSFFTADVDVLSNSYFYYKVGIISDIAKFIITISALIWLHYIVALALLALSVIPILMTNLFTKNLQKRKKEYSDNAASYVDVVKECLDGKKEIISYDKQDVFLQKHDPVAAKMEKIRAKSAFTDFYSFIIPVFVGHINVVIVTGLGVFFVIQGQLTLGAIIAVINLMGNVSYPVTAITEAVNSMRSAKDILKKAHETNEKEPEKPSVKGFKNTIELRKLGLSYDSENYVIKDLNFSFKKGVKYAVLAPSGYGKSSIARALALEFADIEGSITIDGNDIHNVDPKSYNNILRYIRQDPYLFSDTALNNLTFFNEMPNKEELERVLKISRANEFLFDDESLNRYISNTSGLSGGQKQRIVLARALLHNPEVLILDEITSNIDLETSFAILKDLFEDKDITVIAITHENNEDFLGLFDEVVYLGA